MSYDDDMVFLTTRDVIEKTGLSSTTMQRRRESDPTFPKPVVLSCQATSETDPLATLKSDPPYPLTTCS